MKRLFGYFAVVLFLSILLMSPADAETRCYRNASGGTTCVEDNSVNWGVVIGVFAALGAMTWLIVELADDNKKSLALRETESFLKNNLETSYDTETNRIRIGFTSNF